MQLGLGATGYIERIGVTLPMRNVSATDRIGLLTANLGIGVLIAQRWEIALHYEQNLELDFYKVYQGSETLPFRGIGKFSIGRKL